MSVQVDQVSSTQKRIAITVPQAEVKKKVDDAFKRYAGKINLPGFRRGHIPRNIIEHFVASFNGAEIFRLKLSSAIAANPFVVFQAAVKESGTLAFRWTGDEGFAIEQSVAIAVE